MQYCFVEGASLAEGQVVDLLSADVNHVYRVLRLREGATLYISDGRGAVYSGIITSALPKSVKVRLVKPVAPAEPSLHITLLQSLAKGEKMDLIVRQSVELGVSRIIPVSTGRSVPRWDESKEQRRLMRWRSIARSAAAQCRRGRIPTVEQVLNFKQVMDRLSPQREGVTVVPWEGEKQCGAGEFSPQNFPQRGFIFLFIGPEGGFEESEIKVLSASGAITIHLGPRILRTETAAAVSLALIQAAWGDLGGGCRL